MRSATLHEAVCYLKCDARQLELDFRFAMLAKASAAKNRPLSVSRSCFDKTRQFGRDHFGLYSLNCPIGVCGYLPCKSEYGGTMTK